MPAPPRTVVIPTGFGVAAIRTFVDQRDRVWGAMRDTDGRNTSKKAGLEGYSPNIAIAEMGVTGDASETDGFVFVMDEGTVDFLTNNADPEHKTRTLERTKTR